MPRIRLRILILAPLAALALASPRPAAAATRDAGPISRLEFVGNVRTQEVVIRRVMNLAEGDTLDADRLDAAWDALEDSGLFRYVDLDSEPDDGGGQVLTVTVEEDLSTYYGPLVRHDRRHKYLLGGWLEERNLGGRAQSVRLEVSAWHLQMADLRWRAPWLAGVRGLTGSVGVHGEQSDFVFRPTRYRQWDGDLALRWNFHGPVFVQAGARHGRFIQRDSYLWEAPDRGGSVPPASVENLAGSEDHWRLAAGIGLDSRDNTFYPHHGANVLVETARWSSNSFADYDELTGNASAFIPLPKGRHLLALRAWGRRVSGPAPLENQLFLGGPESVRGARFGSLEGDQAWLLTAEYRLPLVLVPIAPSGESVGLGLHVFTDGGQAWFKGAEPGDPVFTWGAGAHVTLDTWQLRFEAARDEAHDWHFEFADRFSF